MVALKQVLMMLTHETWNSYLKNSVFILKMHRK